MHRTKTFMYNLGEDIVGRMEKMETRVTPSELTVLASMAKDYNELCKFVEKHGEHKKMMVKEGSDNPKAMHAKADNPY